MDPRKVNWWCRLKLHRWVMVKIYKPYDDWPRLYGFECDDCGFREWR